MGECEIFMLNCSKCKGSMSIIGSVRNLHITGDPKHIKLYECSKCKTSALQIYMDAHTFNGDEYLEYRIDLNQDETEEFSKLMNECPNPTNEDCKCYVHNKLDNFEMQNIGRRILVHSEFEKWK